MTPETRKLLLSRVMLEADRGCPSGFRAFALDSDQPERKEPASVRVPVLDRRKA